MTPKEKTSEVKEEAKEESSAMQVTALVIGAALYPGAKVIPTAETLEYCHKHGEKYVPRMDPTNRYNLPVSPLAVIPVMEDGELITYYEIPDSTGKIFRVPSSVLTYKPPAD